MLEECLLFVAGENANIVDAMGGCLLIPADDDESQAMAQRNGYELVCRGDERYAPALRRAYDTLHNKN